MASERRIKRRIRSATNIAQITKAMQMVAASKMKKAQSLALSGRPYVEKIAEMVSKFVKRIDMDLHPLLGLNERGKTVVVLISTNKGLCGGLNTTLFRFLVKTYGKETLKNFFFVTVGKKAERFLVRIGVPLLADFSSTVPFSKSISALTKFLIDGYLKGEFREVHLVYNNYISALTLIPIKKRILPVAKFEMSSSDGSVKKVEKDVEFLVEPSVDAILDTLLSHFLENQIRDAILEAEASEHSARMLAMKNATDNANELIEILALEYNKARQEKITYEIADIVTARLALD